MWPRRIGLLVFTLTSGMVFLARMAPPAAAQNATGGVELGRELYDLHCSACHGVEGRGDGPVAPHLKTLPSDLTRIQKPGQVFPRGRVAEVIDGEKTVAAHGNRTMPVWGRVFRAEAGYTQAQDDIHQLVRYLETIQIYRSSEK